MMRSNPGKFPVGSPASRAAARALIDERRAHAKMVDMVMMVEGAKLPIFHEWVENSNGTYTRRSEIPWGMTFEEAESVAGIAPIQPKGEYLRFIHDIPRPDRCGSL